MQIPKELTPNQNVRPSNFASNGHLNWPNPTSTPRNVRSNASVDRANLTPKLQNVDVLTCEHFSWVCSENTQKYVLSMITVVFPQNVTVSNTYPKKYLDPLHTAFKRKIYAHIAFLSSRWVWSAKIGQKNNFRVESRIHNRTCGVTFQMMSNDWGIV